MDDSTLSSIVPYGWAFVFAAPPNLPEGRLTKHSPYFSQLLIGMYIFYNTE